MRTALITGDVGFVGRHFKRRLYDDGWELVVCDIAGPRGVDCRELFASKWTCDLVIHCAANVGGRAKIDGAPMSVAENLSIDSALWQWALRTRPGRVVYFSSSAAYPISYQTDRAAAVNYRLEEGDINLRWLHHPDQTYGLAKLVGEVQAELVRNEGVPVTVIRPFSGYGTDQPADYPFPAFIIRALGRKDPFEIWGDGQQARDWVHIDDIVELTMRCIRDGVDGPLNACTGRATTFDELATIVCREAGYMPDLEHLEAQPSGVQYRVGDPTRMLDLYRPGVTLEEGIRRALEG